MNFRVQTDPNLMDVVEDQWVSAFSNNNLMMILSLNEMPVYCYLELNLKTANRSAGFFAPFSPQADLFPPIVLG